MRGSLQTFWAWYERHILLYTVVAALLFSLQLIHLYWLATDVIALRLLGQNLFSPPPFWKYLIIVVDYTEVPALISTSLLYAHDWRVQGFRWKSFSFLCFLNAQWLHLFWITDEFVISQLLGASEAILFPVWLVWIAIFIDYLELPVIVDTMGRLLGSVARHRLPAYLREVRYNLWHLR